MLPFGERDKLTLNSVEDLQCVRDLLAVLLNGRKISTGARVVAYSDKHRKFELHSESS